MQICIHGYTHVEKQAALQRKHMQKTILGLGSRKRHPPSLVVVPHALHNPHLLLYLFALNSLLLERGQAIPVS